MYDAVVLGLGGMGSAALAHLAKRGTRVLGLDRFGRGHDRGASTGGSRMIRQAYFEHPAYVPLLRRAYELWHELEAQSGTTLLDLCGILMVGTAASAMLGGARTSATRYDIALETLTAADVRRRYPALDLRADEFGVFEPGAGIVFPEAAIDAHLRVALANGAQARFDCAVRSFTAGPDDIELTLADGSSLRTQRLVLCAGPWLGALATELGLPLRVERNVQLWFAPATPAYDRERFCAFLLDRAELPAPLYGFPAFGGELKAALHGYGDTTGADELDRTIRPSDIEPVRAALDAFMPGAAATFVRGKACMYTLTPDEHFIIDTDPRDPRIVLAGGFSGHGYKFCPVVGEIVAELAIDGASRHPIDFLKLGRLVPTA